MPRTISSCEELGGIGFNSLMEAKQVRVWSVLKWEISWDPLYTTGSSLKEERKKTHVINEQALAAREISITSFIVVINQIQIAVLGL